MPRNRAAGAARGGQSEESRLTAQPARMHAMKMRLTVRGIAMVLVAGGSMACRGGAGGAFDLPAAVARSQASTGDTARLGHALAKARRGEAVTIGVIGGSITQGAAATKAEFRYGDRISKWWRDTFPKATVEFVNAGIGATGSNFGALRVQRDLLARNPDVVIVEYGVNDGNDKGCAETLEGVVRQILRQPNHPAVLLLFMMHQGGGNAQEWHGKVGKHYGLPMVSLRDALWPEIKAGRLRWEEVVADTVHPNDRGHDYAAQFVIAAMGQALKALPADDGLPAIKPLPAPLISDLFEHAALYEAAALKPVSNEGWMLDAQAQCWKSDKPGSVIEFEVEGNVILMMHFIIKGPMGMASVRVDDKPPLTKDGWFDQTWGGYRNTCELARDLGPGPHRVRLELLDKKAAGSTGNEFRLLGFGAAGK
ncbi:MAG: GDSL-type esterase/lipase family protein [Planctomycetota bacterium]